jgi:hypothetical protein
MENILRPFGIIYGHLVQRMAVWYSLWSFGILFPFWYVLTKKNLATLLQSQQHLRAYVATKMSFENCDSC